MTRNHTIRIGLAGLAALVLAIAGGLVGCSAGEESPVPSDAQAAVAEGADDGVVEAPARKRPSPRDHIDIAGSASLGPANAPVTLVEYSDFQ